MGGLVNKVRLCPEEETECHYLRKKRESQTVCWLKSDGLREVNRRWQRRYRDALV